MNNPPTKTAPFDLTKALAGHPLVTRDGRAVTGFRQDAPNNNAYPFRAIDFDGDSVIYTAKGEYFQGEASDMDLFLDISWEVEPPVKCLASGCTNRTNEGMFVGELCAPCHHALKKGDLAHFERRLKPGPPETLTFRLVDGVPMRPGSYIKRYPTGEMDTILVGCPDRLVRSGGVSWYEEVPAV